MSIYQTLKHTYIDKKLKIFPIIENGKTPLIREWQNDCSCSTLQIMYWLENTHNCNWALPCTQNDLFVLDIDMHDVNGLESAKKLFNDLGINKIDTLYQRTPSGGVHLIFKSDDDLKKVANTSNSFKDYQGIDIRTDGYILVYPSKIDTKEYQFVDDTPIQEMPKELKNFILSQKKLVKHTTEKKEYEKPSVVNKGSRDEELFEYVNYLYFHTRLSSDEILTLANDFNENICEPSLNKKVVAYKVKQVFKKDRGKCIYLKLGNLESEENENGN